MNESLTFLAQIIFRSLGELSTDNLLEIRNEIEAIVLDRMKGGETK